MRKGLNLFCQIFNIKADKNQRWLLMSTVVRGLMMAYCAPIFHKTIVSELPAEWIAIDGISCCAFGLVAGMIYRGQLRKTAIKWFRTLLVTESACGFILAIYLAIFGWNAWVFAITSLVYSNLITEFISKCCTTFKAVLWEGEKREEFDITKSNVSQIVALMGLVFALVAMPSLQVSLYLWAASCIIDDAGWFMVYTVNKKKLQNL